VGVQLGIAGARGAVRIGGGEEAVAGDELGTALAAPRPAGLALQVAERLGGGGAVGLGDLAGDRMAAERPGQRDGLGSGEGEVEAGDRLAAWRETPVTTLIVGSPQPEALEVLANLLL
jgi:hypothetical protein